MLLPYAGTMMVQMSLLASVVVAAPITDHDSDTTPQQVHIALGTNSSTMSVEWTTMSELKGSATVSYGTDPSTLSSTATAQTTHFFAQGSFYLHTAVMTGLTAKTQYYYKVCGDQVCSSVFKFTGAVAPGDGGKTGPSVHLLYGDMGAAFAFTLCQECTGNLTCDASTCTNKSTGLVSEIDEADMILHTGDFAYDFDSSDGTVGHQFMRNIEQVASEIPYMVSIGNHEDGPQSLAHFTERFNLMPSNTGSVVTLNGKAKNNWFFSWDAGLVHYIALSTEAWFSPLQMVKLEEQYKFLIADLEKANQNRDKVPWIIAHGHRSVYCSCDNDCDAAAKTVREGKYGLEEVFMKYGVDFWINGHEHDYERSYPMYKNVSDRSNINPKAPIYVVTGAAGSHELHEPFTRPQPDWSAFRSNSFGYSKIYVHNASHLRWQQIQTDPTLFGPDLYGRVIDDAWIIQDKHGPFNVSDPPSGRVDPSEVGRVRSYDHWDAIFEEKLEGAEEASHADKLEDVITKFRKKFGNAKWKKTEIDELAEFEAKIGGDSKESLVWEDVRADGNSDGHWSDRDLATEM